MSRWRAPTIALLSLSPIGVALAAPSASLAHAAATSLALLSVAAILWLRRPPMVDAEARQSLLTTHEAAEAAASETRYVHALLTEMASGVAALREDLAAANAARYAADIALADLRRSLETANRNG